MKNYEKFNEDYGYNCKSEDEMIDAFHEVSEVIGYANAVSILQEEYYDIGDAFKEFYQSYGFVGGVEQVAQFVTENDLYDEYINNYNDEDF